MPLILGRGHRQHSQRQDACRHDGQNPQGHERFDKAESVFRRLHCCIHPPAWEPDHHCRTRGVAVTVVAYTADPLVMYSALPPVGSPSVSIGMPRELNTMQAVSACGSSSSESVAVHSGDWPITVCVLRGGAGRAANPNVTPFCSLYRPTVDDPRAHCLVRESRRDPDFELKRVGVEIRMDPGSRVPRGRPHLRQRHHVGDGLRVSLDAEIRAPWYRPSGQRCSHRYRAGEPR